MANISDQILNLSNVSNYEILGRSEYRVVQKKWPLFPNSRPSAARQLGLPMHSQSRKLSPIL